MIGIDYYLKLILKKKNFFKSGRILPWNALFLTTYEYKIYINFPKI